MIKFGDIEYSNIMSVGNNPVYFELNADHKTLVTGTNGAGKSTFIEALTFALYGKPFRNIKKPQLVNTVNKKKLLVTLNFQDRKHTYKVVRGIKPNKFEIYKDGDLIPQEAAVADYQEMFEKQILGMSLSTFKQIAVLGSAGYTPFMLLTAGKRREIIEDLLDIGIFSSMADLNKLELRKLNDSIKTTQADIEARMNEIRIHVEYQKENQSAVGDDMAKLEARLAEYELLRDELELQIETYTEESAANHSALTEHDERIAAQLKSLSDMHDKVVAEMDALYNQVVGELTTARDANIADLEKKHTAAKDEFESKIAAEKADLTTTHESARFDYEAQFEDNKPPQVSVDEIAEKRATIKTNKTSLEALAENKGFYDHNVTCPTCRQDIPEQFAKEFIDLANKQIDELKAATIELVQSVKQSIAINEEYSAYMAQGSHDTGALDAAQSIEMNALTQGHVASKLEMIGAQSAEKAEIESEYNQTRNETQSKHLKERKVVTDKQDIERTELTSEAGKTRITLSDARHESAGKLQTAKTSKVSTERQIRDTQADLDSLIARSKAEDRSELIKTLSSDLKGVKLAYEHDVNTKHARDIVGSLLKDSGVKTMIIRQYIPMINKFINDYLKTMGANYNFILDEEFDETIKSRGRDDFSYTSFSQGERMRIDLALLFAFRDLVSARTGAMSSILVLDEVFDSATDQEGVDDINSILDNLPDNVMVISHNEKNQEKQFDRHIKFVKVGNFTRLED